MERVTAEQPFVYVANQVSSTVSVVDPLTGAVIDTIPTAFGPVPAAVHPNGLTVYVGSFNEVAVIDTRGNTVTATIPADGFVDGVALHPSGERMYFSHGDDLVTIVDAASNAIIDSVTVGSLPAQIAILPDGSAAYVTNLLDDTATVIDLDTNSVVATVPVGPFPSAVAVHPDGSLVYVGAQDGTVTVIDTVTNTVVATAFTESLIYDIGFFSDGSQFVVAQESDQARVRVVDASTLQIVETIEVGSNAALGVSIGSQGDVYVAVVEENELVVLDSTSWTVIQRIGVGESPFGVVLAGPRLFSDGFESGDTSAWSATVE